MQSVPAGLEFACFGIMMILEYFSLIFCRSALSIQFFPRAVFLIWMAFHIYFYIVPYGFLSEVRACGRDGKGTERARAGQPTH